MTSHYGRRLQQVKPEEPMIFFAESKISGALPMPNSAGKKRTPHFLIRPFSGKRLFFSGIVPA